MNRKELIRKIADTMRDDDVRKPLSFPKHVIHISDDEGNSKDFVIKKRTKGALFTIDDISMMLDACLHVIEEAVKNGEKITIPGFGSLGLIYRQERRTLHPVTGNNVTIAGHYIPRFISGKDLKMCAKIFEVSLEERRGYDTDLPIFDESEIEETDEENKEQSIDVGGDS